MVRIMVKVSVLVPFYNSELFLRDCIDSILNQTYRDFELILLNDGSTDKSEQIVKSYNDTRIKYFTNPEHYGISSSYNMLNELAQGEYLALVDCKNLCLPQRLSEQARYLDEHQDVAVVGSWGRFFCNMPTRTITEKVKSFIINMGWVWRQPQEATMEKALQANPCLHSSIMIRKRDFWDNGIFYNHDFSVAADYDMIRQVLVSGLKIRNIQKALIEYRIDDETFSLQKIKMIKTDEARVKADICSFLKIRNYKPYPYWKVILEKLRLDFGRRK